MEALETLERFQGIGLSSNFCLAGPGLPEDVRSNGALTVEQQAELAHVEAVLQAHANAKREALAARQGQERAKEEQVGAEPLNSIHSRSGSHSGVHTLRL